MPLEQRELTFRNRVYDSYVSGRPELCTPAARAEWRPRAAHLRKLLREHFPEDRSASILDVGCGSGALLFFARQEGYTNICGVDGSPEQVAAAQQLGIEGVSVGDGLERVRCAPSESFDVIVTFDVVEHLTRDEFLSFADDVQRVLRPDGRWILHTVNAESPVFGRVRYGDVTHEIAYTHASISQLLYAAGFRNVQCFEDGPVAHGCKSTARWLLWKCIRGVLRFYLLVENGSAPADCILSQNFYAVARKR